MEILIDNEAVKSEYSRWHTHFGDADPYTANGNIGIHDVLRAHFLIVDYFYDKGGMGGIGPRDANLLHSAVYRQFTGYAGKEKWKTPFERCATLIFGLVKDHPFHDANKRTALLVLLYFLSSIKRVPDIDHKELDQFVIDIAESRLNKYARFQSFLTESSDPEIEFIADFLKRNSRKMEKQAPASITFRELDECLRPHGFCLMPNGNDVKVCRIETVRSLNPFSKERKTKYVSILQVSFPGWKRPVGKKTVSKIREEANLTAEKGFDSKTFFDGADPLNALIAEYAGPLERLASR